MTRKLFCAILAVFMLIGVFTFSAAAQEDTVKFTAIPPSVTTCGDEDLIPGRFGMTTWSTRSIAANYPNNAPADVDTVEEKVDWIAGKCREAGMTEEWDIAVWLHDWLIYNANYDYTYSIYRPDGVLLEGTGVCQSYAEAYELLLDEFGIENIILSAYEMDHAWNLVKIDGEWCHVDCTWDDPNEGGGYENHTYFGMTDKMISADHSWNTNNYVACTSKINYYPIRMGYDVFETQEELEEILCKRAAERAEELDLYYIGGDPSFRIYDAFLEWDNEYARDYGLYISGGSYSNTHLYLTVYYWGVPSSHVHSYQQDVYDPTCTDYGYTLFYCSCGSYYIDDYVDPLDHDYESTVTPATCTENGYTTYTCTVCGDVYTDDYIEALGHYVLRPGVGYVDAYTLHNSTTDPFDLIDGWYASTNKSDYSTSTFRICADYDCTMVLKYKVSSEQYYDILEIVVNENTIVIASGEMSETSITLNLTAGDVVSVTYSKDISVSVGSDTGYFKIDSCTQIEEEAILQIPAEEAEPTCTEAVICESCSMTIKEALGHSWNNTSGLSPKTCTVCGATEGVAAHTFTNSVCTGCGAIQISETTFPDANFRAYITDQTYGADGVLTTDELLSVTEIYVSEKIISDLTGIQYFTALERLFCYDNQLTSLDVTKNTALDWLSCGSNQLTRLDVTKNTALTQLSCYNNQLTNLDVSKNTALTVLSCGENPLTSLDVTKNTALDWLSCGSNQLTRLDVTKNTALTFLDCSINQLTSLDVSKNTALTVLYCSSNQLTGLDVTENTALTLLHCDYNQLTSLDVSGCPALEELYCDNNQRTISVIQNRYDLSDLAADGFDISKASNWQGGTVSGNVLTVTSDTVTYTYDLGNGETETFTLTVGDLCTHSWTSATCTAPKTCSLCGATEGGVDSTAHTFTNSVCTGCGAIQISETTFPDANFRAYITDQTYGADGVLTTDELLSVTEIYVSEKNISDLTGIQYFTALKRLYCYNNQLTGLDVSKNTALTELSCYDNNLTSLDVTKNTALTHLYCHNNQLTSLDVTKNTALTGLSCDYNQLTSLDVTKNIALEYLYCYANQLTSLDVTKNTALTELYCWNNQLTSLDVTENTALEWLSCDNNQLTSLDVSKNTALTDLDCSTNQLTGLDVTENTALTHLYCGSNQLTGLDVTKNTALTHLYCYGNNLTSLDVTKNTALTVLSCGENPLTSLDVSKNTALTVLSCDYNQLTGLDVTKNTALKILYCWNNQLTSLDVSGCPALEELYCHNNQRTISVIQNRYDLSDLAADGFDISKASNWQGGTVSGNVLTVTSDTVTYTYDLGNGETETFTLIIDGTCDHIFVEKADEQYLVSAADCTAAAVYHKSCSGCGAVSEDTFGYGAPLGHTGGTATCKDPAVCTRCEQPYGELDNTNHVGGTEIRDAVSATCTVDGYTGDTWCLGCQRKIAEGETLTAPGHNYSSVVTDPTCTGQGYTTHTCSCGDSFVENYVPATGHIFIGSDCLNCHAVDESFENPTCGTSVSVLHDRMTALQEHFPEGMPWTNDHYYGWNGGIYSGGYGCAGFAFMLSDAAFGSLPAEIINEDISISKIRVGDILRVNGNTHSVIVLEVHADYVVIAEGNFNYSIHWGRELTAKNIIENVDYIMTRYPDHHHTSVVTEPTCTEQGYTTHTCSCGDRFVDSYVDALDHKWDDGVITKEPTEDEEGTKLFTCERCGETREEPLPKLDPLPLPEAEVAVARMILGNELAMQFAFLKENIAEGVEYVVSVTKTYADGREDKNILVPQNEWKTNGPYYYVSFNGIAAKEMGDTINVQILTAEGVAVGDVYTDSVKAYAVRQLRKAIEAEIRTLYVDMLNYGAAAQTYFKYDAANLVTKGLTETEKSYGTQSVKLENNLVKGTGYVASQLDLGSSILLRVKFNGIDSSMHAVVSFTSHTGVQKNVTIPGSEFISGGTVVVINQVVAADYNQDVTITVYDAGGTEVANAVESVASYLARQLEKPNPLAIYDAVAKYCAAAYGYLHK